MVAWNPWRSLRDMDVDLWFAALGGARGLWTRADGRDEILIEETLGRRERREVLAHEIVHAERAVGWPDASAATMELEEERVWRIALRRLAPPEQVREFLLRRGTVGPVTVEDLAEEFDLSPGAAARVARLVALEVGFVDPEAVEAEGDAHG
ncbi:MAG: hypothetical protein JWM47_707 [Acidimicrobiales bacterium]|nr:hypothetical protein [Acidimicrobiales bacterium]